MNSLVSIIIPTFNRAHLISETLDSIVNQTYSNWECIIVDDGSTDNSFEIINTYIKKDSRFKLFPRPKSKIKGANSCRNYGFSKCTGEYVKWFDSDDIMLPNFLASQLSVIESNNKLDFCVSLSETFIEGTNTRFVNKANRIISKNNISNYLFKNHYFLTGAPLWKRNFLISFDYLFDENLTNSDETDFHFRVILKKPIYIYTDDVLYLVRRGNESVTQSPSNNFNSLNSKFVFFDKVYKQIKTLEFQDKKLVIIYILSRQLSIIYQIVALKGRLFTVKKYFCKVIHLLIISNLSLFRKCKIFIGLLFILFLKKGFNLINLKLGIRENIEN
ncbi:MAG: glycosyltransferase family 2 protein [Flavobacterium sp.]|nr:glycosyltransferase family 2 protein [Flavobacterium sp.]